MRALAPTNNGDIVYAEVSGSGEFPLDMLRRDCCSPATEEDSHVIRDTFRNHQSWIIRIRKVLRGRHRDPGPPFNVARWKSFRCSIRPATGPRPPRECETNGI